MTPEGLPKLFAAAFSAQDAAALAGFLADDADVMTLTGAVAENAGDARRLFEAEFSGVFAGARLVSGKTRLRGLGASGAILHQRFVVIGARDAKGGEMPRFGAVLTAVLLEGSEGWRAVSLNFSALTQ
jgi:ketosteroid isomerase-like protein